MKYLAAAGFELTTLQQAACIWIVCCLQLHKASNSIALQLHCILATTSNLCGTIGQRGGQQANDTSVVGSSLLGVEFLMERFQILQNTFDLVINVGLWLGLEFSNYDYYNNFHKKTTVDTYFYQIISGMELKMSS